MPWLYAFGMVGARAGSMLVLVLAVSAAGTAVDCGGGPLAPAGQDAAGHDGAMDAGAALGCPGTVQAGYSCDAGTACPQDPSRPASSACTCMAGYWHCTFSDCPSYFYWGFNSDGFECGYIEVPAGCACAPQEAPQQGRSYCLCMVTDAGG